MVWIVAALVARIATDLSFKLSVTNIQFRSFRLCFPQLRQLTKNPWIYTGIGLSGVDMVIWTHLLGRYNLSLLYPLFSLSYVAMILVGRIAFREKLDRYKIGGMLLIIWGGFILLLEALQLDALQWR